MKDVELRLFSTAIDSVNSQAAYYEIHESPRLAQHWLDAFKQTVDQLLDFPESRPAAGLGDEFPSDLRRAIILDFPDFLLFYRYNPREGILRVVAVHPGCMDLGQALMDTAMDE